MGGSSKKRKILRFLVDFDTVVQHNIIELRAATPGDGAGTSEVSPLVNTDAMTDVGVRVLRPTVDKEKSIELLAERSNFS